MKTDGRIFCVFVDMKMENDKLSIYMNGNWLKLYRPGIDGKCLRMIKYMYSQMKYCVKHCNSYSDFLMCCPKQGEIMSLH